MAEQVNFTKAFLAQVAPPATSGARLTFRDSKVAGLELRVTSTGVKTFSLLRWIPGDSRPERITIGRFPDLSVEQARKIAGEHIAAIASGQNPAELKRAAKGEMTFADLFAEYITRHAKVHKKTWREDQEKFDRYLSSRSFGVKLSAMKLSQITRGDIARIHAKIGETNPVPANRALALISSVFGRAVEWGLYEKLNPARGIKKFKESSRERFLQKNELPRFFAALAREPNPLLRDFFLICLLTGARRGNVQSMRWADLDLENRVWTVPAQQSKNARPLHVMLSEEAIEILRERNTDANRRSGYVFPSRGKTGYLAEPRKGWERLLDIDELDQLAAQLAAAGQPFEPELGEPLTRSLARARLAARKLQLDCGGTRLFDLRIHDLRRTLGAWQAKQGASTLIIGKSLGHLSQAATQIYARLDRDPVQDSVERATTAMLEAGGMKPQRSKRDFPGNPDRS